MTVRVIQGDCRAILKHWDGDAFDCVVTDPPYGETSLKWDQRVDGWLDAVGTVLKPNASIWVFGSMRFFIERGADFAGWKQAQDIVWEKHNGTGLFADRFRRCHEHAVQFYRGNWADVFKEPQFTNDATARTVRKKGRPAQWIGATGETIYRSEDGGPRLMRSVMFERSEHSRAIHPTQKPVPLIQNLLRYSCPAGGRVLDPFSGSGSTGIAARLLDMDATLIEVSGEYVAASEQRLRDDAPMLSLPLTA